MTPPRKKQKTKEPIIFDNEDLENVDVPHDDAVIIIADIANCTVQRLQLKGFPSSWPLVSTSDFFFFSLENFHVEIFSISKLVYKVKYTVSSKVHAHVVCILLKNTCSYGILHA